MGTDTQTHRHTDTQTHRHTDTDTQTHRQRHPNTQHIQQTTSQDTRTNSNKHTYDTTHSKTKNKKNKLLIFLLIYTLNLKTNPSPLTKHKKILHKKILHKNTRTCCHPGLRTPLPPKKKQLKNQQKTLIRLK